MAARRYRLGRRAETVADTRERIVAATVALHRERGTLATSYADIAKEAGVSLQTVHNHFPSLGDLLPACMGAAAVHAPVLGAETFADIAAAEERLAAFARALLAQHAYYEPWMRWAVHEAHAIPDLGAALAQRRVELKHLVAQAVAPAFAGDPPASLVALLATLLDIESWMLLRAQKDLSHKAADAALLEGARALLRHFAESAPARQAALPSAQPKGKRR
ncbi:MAG: TetR/AcrR family transcriptional regulator [Pseudomonadota bacterium]